MLLRNVSCCLISWFLFTLCAPVMCGFHLCLTFAKSKSVCEKSGGHLPEVAKSNWSVFSVTSGINSAGTKSYHYLLRKHCIIHMHVHKLTSLHLLLPWRWKVIMTVRSCADQRHCLLLWCVIAAIKRACAALDNASSFLLLPAANDVWIAPYVCVSV